MNYSHYQKSSTLSNKVATSASSVLDNSSQGESLQRKADMANSSAQRAEAPRPNNTGMPDNLKAGIESLSGFSMDDVRVHYNSSKPATVQALAYTQGTDIHVAPGQEKHLPHEAWHVAQQMAGRVSPTTNINGMPVNDNAALEHEADVMGEKAVTQMFRKTNECQHCDCGNGVLQCRAYIAKRPLAAFEKLNLQFPLVGNTGVFHSHIFIEKNHKPVWNVGFHSSEGFMNGRGELFTEHNNNYVVDRQIYPDFQNNPNLEDQLQNSLIDAIIHVGTNAPFDKYHLLKNNCQDWTDAVLYRYNTLRPQNKYSEPVGLKYKFQKGLSFFGLA
ncbi:MAG: DUF4157 domain-containing protein [Fibrobacter sp.]|nr:DUF4157 domain-containing protein [Fibrobacter sp.]